MTATTTTLTTTDAVMAEDTAEGALVAKKLRRSGRERKAVAAIPAPDGALVAKKLRRSGQERKTATTTTTTTAPEETAVVALPAPVGNPVVNYFISKHDETKAGNPNASFNDIKAIILKEWCKLPKEERAKYEYEFELVQAEGELVWQSSLLFEFTTLTHSFFYCCHSLSVATVVTNGDSESESDAEDVGNTAFVFVELDHRGDNVSDEEVETFLDHIREYSRVVVLGDGALSNEQAASLYEDYADGFGYQENHERGTMQNETITKIINATNDDPDSIDQVGVFLREKVDSVEKALGTKVIDSFLNLNRGQKKTPEQEQAKGELVWWSV